MTNSSERNESMQSPLPPGRQAFVYVWGMYGNGKEHVTFVNKDPPNPCDIQDLQIAVDTHYFDNSYTAYELSNNGTSLYLLWDTWCVPITAYDENNDSDENRPTNDKEKSLRDYTLESIHSGFSCCFGIVNDGRLVSWTSHQDDNAGRLHRETPLFPKCSVIPFPDRSAVVTQVVCGMFHIMALTSEGSVYSWGNCVNSGQDCDLDAPKKLEQLDHLRVTHIACSGDHSAAVTADGDVYTWGEAYGSDAELTLGRSLDLDDDRFIPMKIPPLPSNAKAAMVSCGDGHSAILTTEGLVYCWGRNDMGQLGVGHFDEVNGFHRPTGVDHFPLKKVVCGMTCTFALSESGEVFSWGRCNGIGHGEQEVSSTPQKIESLSFLFVADILCTCEGVLVACATQRSDDFSPLSLLPQFDDKGSFQDVTFTVGGKELHAHRCILAQRCEFFKTMFGSGMKEACGEVLIKDVQYSTFKKLLEYLYTDKIEATAEDIMELFRLADMYGLPKLQGQCRSMLPTLLNVDNSVSLLNEANELCLDQMKDICFAFVQANFDEVSLKINLCSEITQELLVELVRGKKLL